MTERELMEKVTPGFVRWLMRYAPGFQLLEDADRVGFMLLEYRGIPVFDLLENNVYFANLLIDARTGVNESNNPFVVHAVGDWFPIKYSVSYGDSKPFADYPFENYTGTAKLWPSICALLHCLLDLYQETAG